MLSKLSLAFALYGSLVFIFRNLILMILAVGVQYRFKDGLIKF
jgi:hypothetical protein